MSTIADSPFKAISILYRKSPIWLDNSFFDLRYPFWHDWNLKITGCELTENCRADEADLAFEKSQVEAELTAPLISVKNPYQGCIRVSRVGEVIRDAPAARAEICIQSPSAELE